MIGKTIAHYKITEKIGQGGMGEVYRATDTNLKRDVALKILPESFAQNPQRMARFQREAEVLASLNHPNIAGIYGLEQQGSTHAIAMELVDGETLAARIQKGAIPLEEALNIALQIAEALEAAHEKGIIHRDLKPANVIVTSEGTVKVLDFGLAKAIEAEPTSPEVSQSPTLTMQATQAGIILGTAAYMSPEQAKGKPVDKRADTWAFGVVLFEMLTGRKVFEAEDISDTMAAVLRAEPSWEHLPEDAPQMVEKLLRRCLSREPRRRLRDIGEARIAIEDYLDNPEAETAPTLLPSTRTAFWQQPSAWVTVVAVALVASLAVWFLKPASEPEPESPRRLEVSIGAEASLATSAIGLGAATLLSPDGSLLAFVAQSEGSPPQLHVRRLDQLQATPLSGTEGVQQPFFSPDGG